MSKELSKFTLIDNYSSLQSNFKFNNYILKNSLTPSFTETIITLIIFLKN